MTWVLADYTATTSSELSVHKGQQVEVVHNSSAPADWALVRLSLGEESSEGLVPTCVLKQPPPSVLRTATSPSKRSVPLPIEQDLGKSLHFFLYYYFCRSKQTLLIISIVRIIFNVIVLCFSSSTTYLLQYLYLISWWCEETVIQHITNKYILFVS